MRLESFAFSPLPILLQLATSISTTKRHWRRQSAGDHAPHLQTVARKIKETIVIKYALRCANEHHFDSWFKDSATYEALREDGHVTCPICGEWQVDKALMTPHLANNAGRGRGTENVDTATTAQETETAAAGATAPLSETKEITVDTLPRAPKPGEPMPSQEEITAAFQFFANLKRHVEDTHENVGDDFAEEARKIHYGDERERGIYGNANQDDVEELIDEGIVVMPLPNIRHDA